MKIRWRHSIDEYIPEKIQKFSSKINPSILRDSFSSFSYEKLIKLTKVSKVVRGGRKYRYCALVVVGTTCGQVGFCNAKANDAQDAAIKATQRAASAMISVPLITNGKLTYDISGSYNNTKVLIRPSREGTGIRAGNTVRAILDALGIKDVNAKIIGSNTPHNVIKAVFNALKALNRHYKL